MAVNWTYNAATHQFVNAKTGRALTQKQLIAVRDAFLAARAEDARVLARRYLAGEIAFDVWSAAFKHETAITHAALFQLGSGGNERMVQLSRWGQILQTLLDRQVPYAEGFIRDVRAGLVSDAQMEERAALYMGAAVESYEQANSDEWGIELPYYPGTATCLGNCRCQWLVETVIEGDDEVTYATWISEDDENTCDECRERGNEWDHVEIKRSPLSADQLRTMNPNPQQGDGDEAGADDFMRRAVG